MKLLDCIYPDVLSPAGLPNYDEGRVWKYRAMVPRSQCAHLMTPEAVKNLTALESHYGRNSEKVRSIRDCTFIASESADLIFEPRHIEAMLRAMRGENEPVPGDIRFSGDIAGGGDTADESVMMGRQGSEIVYISSEKENEAQMDEIERGESWVTFLKQIGIAPHQFIMDGGGMGGTVAIYMERRFKFAGLRKFNSPEAYDKDAYYDRYTELHWILRELLELCVLKIPYCRRLLDDMKARVFVTMNDNRVKTQKKTGGKNDSHRGRTGRSPDYLDTLIYLLDDFPVEGLRGLKHVIERADANKKQDDPRENWNRMRASQRNDSPFSGLPNVGELDMTIGELRI